MTYQIREILRVSLTTLFVILTIVLYSKTALAYSEVTLRESHSVTTPYVYVKDVFDGDTAYADHVLAPAPTPGEVLYLGEADLERIIKAFNLYWVDKEDSVASISIDRDARLLGSDKIKDLIKASGLLDDKIKEDFDVTLDNDQSILIPTTKMVDLAVSDLSYDMISERFNAKISATADGQNVKQFNVTGHAARMIDVPVLNRRLRNGEVISARDIETIRTPAKRVLSDIVTDVQDLVGMTPRRGLRDKEFVSHSDIVPPVLVQKNEFVTIEVSNGPIRISTKGRALSNGAKGDLVQIMNNKSKKIVEGYVTGPQRVSIRNENRG